MLLEMKRQIRLNYKDYFLGFGICAALSVLFTAVSAIVVRASHSPSLPPIGTVVFYSAVFFYAFILAVAYVGVQFNTALKMGALRKYYLPTCMLILFICLLALLLLARAWFHLESALLAGLGNQFGISLAMPLPIIAASALGITVTSVWAGAILKRFGRRGFWVIWGLWMLPSLGSGLVSRALDDERTNALTTTLRAVINFFKSLPVAWLWLLAALVLLALMGHTWAMMHKVQVTD